MSLCRRTAPGRIGPLVFQGLSSLTSLLVVVAASSSLVVDEFAHYAVASALWIAASGISQFSLVTAAIYSWSTAKGGKLEFSARALIVVFWACIIATGVITLSFAGEFAGAAVCGALVVLYDSAKRLFVAQGIIWRVVMFEGILAATVPASLWLTLSMYPTAGAAFFVQSLWFAGLLIVLVTSVERGRLWRMFLRWRRACEWLIANKKRISSSFGGSSLSTIGGQVAVVAMAVASPSVVAGYRILQTVFGPINLISATLLLSQSERLIGLPPGRRPRAAAPFIGLLWIASTLAFLALEISGDLFTPILGEAWQIARPALPSYWLLMLVLQFNFGLQLVMRSSRRTWPVLVSGALAGSGFAAVALTESVAALSQLLFTMTLLQIPVLIFGVLIVVIEVRREKE